MFHCIRCDHWIWPWSGLYCKTCEVEIAAEHAALVQEIAEKLTQLMSNHQFVFRENHVQPK